MKPIQCTFTIALYVFLLLIACKPNSASKKSSHCYSFHPPKYAGLSRIKSVKVSHFNNNSKAKISALNVSKKLKRLAKKERTPLANKTQKNTSLTSLFKHFEKPAQTKRYSPNKEIYFEGEKGTRIILPKGSLEHEDGTPLTDEPIEIKLKEYYTKADFLLANLTTSSDGRLLESGGTIHIEARQGDKKLRIKEGNEMYLRFKDNNDDEGMQLFSGERENTVMNWKEDKESLKRGPVNISKAKIGIGGFVADSILKTTKRKRYIFEHQKQSEEALVLLKNPNYNRRSPKRISRFFNTEVKLQVQELSVRLDRSASLESYLSHKFHFDKHTTEPDLIVNRVRYNAKGKVSYIKTYSNNNPKLRRQLKRFLINMPKVKLHPDYNKRSSRNRDFQNSFFYIALMISENGEAQFYGPTPDANQIVKAFRKKAGQDLGVGRYGKKNTIPFNDYLTDYCDSHSDSSIIANSMDIPYKIIEDSVTKVHHFPLETFNATSEQERDSIMGQFESCYSEMNGNCGVCDFQSASIEFLASSGLGFINCDRFLPETVLRNHQIANKKNSQEVHNLVFTNINSVMPSYGQEFLNIPTSYKVKYVSYKISDSNLYLSIKDFNTNQALPSPNYKEVSAEEMFARISAL